MNMHLEFKQAYLAATSPAAYRTSSGRCRTCDKMVKPFELLTCIPLELPFQRLYRRFRGRELNLRVTYCVTCAYGTGNQAASHVIATYITVPIRYRTIFHYIITVQ